MKKEYSEATKGKHGTGQRQQDEVVKREQKGVE